MVTYKIVVEPTRRRKRKVKKKVVKRRRVKQVKSPMGYLQKKIGKDLPKKKQSPFGTSPYTWKAF